MKSEQIKLIIANFFKIKPSSVNDELMIGDIPQWDSLGHVGLMSHLEKTLNITIDVDQSLEMETVEDIIEIIDEIIEQ